MPNNEIRDIEQQIHQLMEKLALLQKTNRGDEVKNYIFSTLEGETNLLELFGENDKLLVIHNMGQGCRYCTLWADGFNGFVQHLESTISVVFVSKDAPKLLRNFANSRGWRFCLASHNGGEYIQKQSVMEGSNNMPGAVVYERNGDKIYRKNDCVFGPGDIYCSMWSLLGLAGLNETNWTPQFTYWKRPQTLDDGGKNIIE